MMVSVPNQKRFYFFVLKSVQFVQNIIIEALSELPMFTFVYGDIFVTNWNDPL